MSTLQSRKIRSPSGKGCQSPLVSPSAPSIERISSAKKTLPSFVTTAGSLSRSSPVSISAIAATMAGLPLRNRITQSSFSLTLTLSRSARVMVRSLLGVSFVVLVFYRPAKRRSTRIFSYNLVRFQRIVPSPRMRYTIPPKLYRKIP